MSHSQSKQALCTLHSKWNQMHSLQGLLKGAELALYPLAKSSLSSSLPNNNIREGGVL